MVFETALVLVDEQARPIIIIPEDLPEGDTFLNIVNGGIDIGVGSNVLGSVRNIDDASLAMLGLQSEVGMATYKAQDGEEMPDAIQYVAKVNETRF